MDWEKQDNELRKLMQGPDFLPDSENWDANGAWQKLMGKKQPAKQRIAPIWMRWAAAACVVGLLGMGYWILQTNHKSIQPDGETGRQNVVQPNGLVEQKISEPDSKKQLPSISTLNENTAGIKNETAKVENSKSKNIEKDNANKPKGKPGSVELNKDVTAGNEKNLLSTSDKLSNIADPEKQALTVIIPAEPEPLSIAVVPAPVAKPKIRVVHYNQLSGNQSTSPPVFVQTKKNQSEWEGLALQAATTRKEPTFQLKIDISPAPKKSL